MHNGLKIHGRAMHLRKRLFGKTLALLYADNCVGYMSRFFFSFRTAVIWDAGYTWKNMAFQHRNNKKGAPTTMHRGEKPASRVYKSEKRSFLCSEARCMPPYRRWKNSQCPYCVLLLQRLFSSRLSVCVNITSTTNKNKIKS